jgi:LPXTG-motif cell wall-anchored protein
VHARSNLIRLAQVLVVTLTLGTLVSVGGGRATAADNGRWSVFPTTVGEQRARTYFQPLLTRGVPISDSLTIVNKTDAPLTFGLYVADAFNTPEGGFASRRPDEPRRDVAAWITLSNTAATVGPHQSVDVPFTIDPPLDATPGDHPGSIVAIETEGTISRRGALNVRAVQAVGARMYARIAGPLAPRLDVTALHVSGRRGLAGLAGGHVDAEVTYKVRNTGNVRLTSTAALQVAPLVGGATRVRPTTLPELLPGGSAVVHQRVSGVLPFGRLKARLRVTSGAPTATGESSTFVIPWLVVVVLAVLAALWIRRRRRRRDERDASEAWSEVDEMFEEARG